MQTARRGELDAAAELARRATRERPGFVDPWFALAAIEQERGDLPAARAAYMEILAIDPTQTAAGTALAHTFLLEKKAGEAREWLLRSIESDPGAEAAFFNLGSLAESSGAWDEAVGWYRISAALDGRDPRAPHAAARVRLRAGRTEEAHALLKEALRRAPEYGPSLSLLANPAPQPDATR
jgi:tetratricopeptide (TPR) repeat protein